MTDIEELLRADAQRWNRDRPALDLDNQVERACTSTGRGRRYLAPILSAAAVAAVAVVIGVSGVFGSHAPAGSGSPSGTSASGSTPLADITGVVWKDNGSSGMVVFGSSTVRIEDGCGGSLNVLTVAGDVLRRGPVITGLGVCSGGAHLRSGGPDPAEQAMTHFHAVIDGPATWSRHGNVLTLTRAGHGSLTLTTDNEPSPQVIGTVWHLTRVQDADGHAHTVDGRLSTLHLDVGGTYTKTAPCGLTRGTYHLTATAITFHATSYGCPNGLVKRPDPTSRYELQGTRLYLTDRAGEIAVYRAGSQ
ncbi:MAG: hypothetical protein J2P17_30705 [Mycobacterium sp.]|nr:hypothetical protein [Mycobacterium sp.]